MTDIVLLGDDGPHLTDTHIDPPPTHPAESNSAVLMRAGGRSAASL